MSFLQLFYDGCNGLRRGSLYDGVPEDYGERNPGSGIFESEDGETYFVEIRDEEVLPLSEYLKKV